MFQKKLLNFDVKFFIRMIILVVWQIFLKDEVIGILCYYYYY